MMEPVFFAPSGPPSPAAIASASLSCFSTPLLRLVTVSLILSITTFSSPRLASPCARSPFVARDDLPSLVESLATRPGVRLQATTATLIVRTPARQ